MSNKGRACLALALVAILAACGSSESSKRATDPTDAPSEQSTTTAASSTGGGGEIDACTLLSDDEAQTVLGEPVTKKGPVSGSGESTCEWDTATEHSITVSVGGADTAPGDELTLDPILGTPEPVAALNGKGFYVAGQVSFAAGNRDNYVQVVTDVTSDVDRTKAEDLAVQLSPKIAEAS